MNKVISETLAFRVEELVIEQQGHRLGAQ